MCCLRRNISSSLFKEAAGCMSAKHAHVLGVGQHMLFWRLIAIYNRTKSARSSGSQACLLPAGLYPAQHTHRI